MSNEPLRTADHIPADSTPAHALPPETLPTDAPRPDPNRTTGLDHDPGPGSPAEELVPGYELLGELGRGGMGIVFRARDTRLNRVVALKMILGRPDTAELMRFRAEAEAMAAVRHPNVAQVFEAGESDGRPFLALELLSAGTLSDYFRAHRARGPAALADVVRKVAAGVAAAHTQGIVHRDLKPGNVLFDETGEPKVTDFGLAKRGTGSDLTQTGQVMGTPAYMAPEQADGNAKFVGPQADVWALGVILYEALTEARPFAATDIRGVLAAVLTAEPAAPRKRNAAVPRDLELICLKCLSKQPHERYPTAKELADDFERYAAGKPISVRPAGPLERGYKWVKRNKVVSGAALAVFLALTVGAGVSFAFGLDAQEQAKEAKKQKKDADDAADFAKGETARADIKAADADREKQEANAQRDEVKVQRDRVKAERDRANALVVQAWLRSFVANNRANPLSRDEEDTFWQLAELRDTPINDLFLKEAILSPRVYAQFESRAEFALHGAIGLDPNRRTRADQLFAAALQQPTNTAEQRTNLALACSHWGLASQGTNDAVAKALTEAMRRTNNPAALEVLATGLSSVAPQSEAAAAQLFLDAMSRTTDARALSPIMRPLLRVVARMEPAAAAAVCARAVEIVTPIAKNADLFYRALLELDLGPLARRMEPAAFAKYLLQVVRTSPQEDHLGRTACARDLAGIAPQLERDAAGAACEQMIERLLVDMEMITDFRSRRDAALAIGQLAPHTKRGAAPRLSERAVKILTAAMDKTKDPATLAHLAVGLAAVSPGTEATAAKLLVEAALKPRDLYALREFAEQLTRLAGQLEPVAASEACERVAKVVADALGRATPQNRSELATAFLGLTRHIEPGAAAKLLTEALVKNKDPKVVGQLATALAALLPRLEPVSAAQAREQIVTILTDAVDKAPDPSSAMASLAPGVVAVARHMEPVAAAQFLTDARDKTEDFGALAALAGGLSAVTPHLERTAAADVCERTAERLIGAPARTKVLGPSRSRATGLPTNRNTVQTAAWSLSAVSLGVPVGYQRGSHTVFATGAFATLHNLLPASALLHPSFHPKPRPLPAQTLVELLKHPFCVGEARRVVLDALALTYQRPFADLWEFVEYAQKHQPQLDLLTPPKRPQQP